MKCNCDKVNVMWGPLPKIVKGKLDLYWWMDENDKMKHLLIDGRSSNIWKSWYVDYLQSIKTRYVSNRMFD